ncbi:MAG: hypothetical protein WC713_11305 [Candidatus Methylomirabilota bacterium]
MAEIDGDALGWYRCSTWTEGDTHGGGASTTAITDATANNVFDDVSDAERSAGDVEYRKIWVKISSGTYPDPKVWIESNTPAVNDTVKILLAGSKSTVSTPATLTGTLQFTNGNTAVVGTATAFLMELAPGEKIYNMTDDGEGDAVTIASITDDTHLTLASNYGGTSGSGKTGAVAGIDAAAANFVAPDAKDHASVLAGRDITTSTPLGIWVQRTVSAGVNKGYEDNSATIAVEHS